MMLNAWQTVWVCMGLSVAVLAVDAFFAARTQGNRGQEARDAARQRRVA